MLLLVHNIVIIWYFKKKDTFVIILIQAMNTRRKPDTINGFEVIFQVKYNFPLRCTTR